MEKIAVYYENRMKHTQTLYGKNAQFQHAKAGGICRNHWASKGRRILYKESRETPDRWLQVELEAHGSKP
jgi:hypothetical protein